MFLLEQTHGLSQSYFFSAPISSESNNHSFACHTTGWLLKSLFKSIDYTTGRIILSSYKNATQINQHFILKFTL
jgi:hypothetical protein